MREGGGLNRRRPCPFIVILPGALEAESKATPQDICIYDPLIRYANCRSLPTAEDFRILAFRRIKIEVSLHTATQHTQFRLALCPKRSQDAAPPLGCGLYR